MNSVKSTGKAPVTTRKAHVTTIKASRSRRHAHGLYPYPDPYYRSIFAQQTYLLHPDPGVQMQLMGMHQQVVPLQYDAVEEPVFVNAKQYHGILRRRQSRAELEARNRDMKSKKPYMHESWHLHAINRLRGCGGRFLIAKKKNGGRKEEEDTTSDENTSEASSSLRSEKSAIAPNVNGVSSAAVGLHSKESRGTGPFDKSHSLFEPEYGDGGCHFLTQLWNTTLGF
ncbi:nuclear transcription factor Y subunit A-4-like isoform X2 [Raphanus sativus]|uniref:Nuclear transcription factor Y subunit n=1 Tax=Raphanus sativus TaxID=3726 RepID=A0A6J0K385_RAPSA|nr:nuclear transcription factor Y subunit A-4 isoform X2 [Raphanus sativus]KAJ4883174.1 nuclear transcription factor Y subunit A-4-like isoform X2 [Raphanus sativus]